MWQRKNLLYYTIIAGIFIALKAVYVYADTGALRFLLAPVNALVSISSGATCLYMPGQGYYYPTLNLLIEKSCSGFSFLLICFAMLGVLLINHAKGKKHKALAILTALAMACVFSIFSNTSRILISVFALQHGGSYVSERYSRLHHVEGVFVYLVSLIAIYIACEHLLKKPSSPHEHSA